MSPFSRRVAVAGPLLGLLLMNLLAAGAQAEEQPAGRANRLIQSSRMLVIAHRGDSRQAPENTLPAFRSALETGAELVELDYRHSSDGVPMVIHDSTLDRTTNAQALFAGSKLPMASRTTEELATLDAGAWFNASFAQTRLPTLAAALDVIQPKLVTLIEHKAGDAATCIELLEQRKEIADVVVQSFDWKFVADCHRLSPTLALAALGDKPLTTARLAEAKATGARVIAWNHRYVGPPQIKAVHDAGLKMWVYTVNDVPRAKQLAAWGIDGIITDLPATISPLRAAP